MPTLRIIFHILKHKELRKIYLNQQPVPHVTSKEIELNQLENDSTVLIDVRYPKEFSKMHIENSINIPMNDFVEQFENFSSYRDKKIILICSNGKRSRWIAQFLLGKKNFSDVFNLEGGLTQWIASGNDIVRET